MSGIIGSCNPSRKMISFYNWQIKYHVLQSHCWWILHVTGSELVVYKKRYSFVSNSLKLWQFNLFYLTFKTKYISICLNERNALRHILKLSEQIPIYNINFALFTTLPTCSKARIFFYSVLNKTPFSEVNLSTHMVNVTVLNFTVEHSSHILQLAG